MHSILLSGKNALLFFIHTVLCLLVSWVLGRTVYRAKLHPLAKVPGPRIAAVTTLWYAYHVRNGHMLNLAKTLHKRYGPVVRVRPNEVWFDSEEAFRVIYSMFLFILFNE